MHLKRKPSWQKSKKRQESHLDKKAKKARSKKKAGKTSKAKKGGKEKQKMNFLQEMIKCAHKSELNQKHCCVAIKHGKVISKYFHNYKRTKMFGYKCGSAHAEMCVVNYLINTFYEKKIKRYILWYNNGQKNMPQDIQQDKKEIFQNRTVCNKT